MPTEIDDRARVEFFRRGTHYYAVGRFAALNSVFPIAGNLLHHAIEMYLKGALVPLVGLSVLRNIKHDLNKLWLEFKVRIPSPEAGTFDGPIVDLHRFERIRYPDNAIREGMEASFAPYRGQRVVTSGWGSPLPSYTLVLEDIDALVKFLFEKAGVNPQFYLLRLRDGAKEYVSRANLHPLE